MLNSKNSKESLEFLVPHSDYIMFLDPDDYWREDCVQECLKAFADSKAQGKQAEIVWFDYKILYENLAYDMGLPTIFQNYLKYFKNTIITPKIWAEVSKQNELFMAFVCVGMIDFDFFKKLGLYFINGIFTEDTPFGIVLFMHANHIVMINEVLYMCHGRDDSTSRYAKSPHISIPLFLQDLKKEFIDPYTIRKYHHLVSVFYITLYLARILEKYKNTEIKELVREHFFKGFCLWSLSIFCFDKDPHNIRQRLPELKPYIKDLHLGRLNLLKHLVISYPKLGFVYAWTQKLKYGGG
ncbi:MAG: hypothetical protein MR629_01840, partial [Helicobacter sp.]|nr:hypothetical protein [Helicobacter sp.]